MTQTWEMMFRATRQLTEKTDFFKTPYTDLPELSTGLCHLLMFFNQCLDLACAGCSLGSGG